MRALLGVSDRTGLVELARGLRDLGVELVATDGTRRALAGAGIEARPVSDLTGLPEMLGGRVKTLHPGIFAGILARRDLPGHLAELEAHGYPPIDIVVVSLYPFEEAVARGASPAEAIEQIDIGGPSLVRAAAKNSDSVAAVVAPQRYGEVLADLREAGQVRPRLRRRLAAEAFAHVAAYDAAVAAHLARLASGDGGDGGEADLPATVVTGGRMLHPLRYGENPHQRGGLYAVPGPPAGIARARRLQGPELSFTNWLDVDAAHRVVSDFEEPAAVVIKHTNPCGFAVGPDARTAYRRAHDCDPRAAYGGVVAVNRPLDGGAAEEVARTFIEAVIAPSVTPEAASRLAARERLRLLAAAGPPPAGELDVRSIAGGLLVQTADRAGPREGMRVVTERSPDEGQWADLLVAWRLCRHVRSNAVVAVREGMAVGVGAGQMSRVEASELAVARAGDRARGACAASDAFFPMPDGLEALAAAGVAAVVQPGGSRRDADVVAAADAMGVAMVVTGERHFRH